MIDVVRAVAKNRRALHRRGVAKSTAGSKRKGGGGGEGNSGKRARGGGGGGDASGGNGPRALTKERQLAFLEQIELGYEAAGPQPATIGIECEQISLTLREAFLAGVLRTGTRLVFAGICATMDDQGQFRLVTDQIFPTPAVMKAIIAKGGFGTNGWSPVSVGNESILDLRKILASQEAIEARKLANFAASAPPFPSAGRASVKRYLNWLGHQKQVWSSQRDTRSAQHEKNALLGKTKKVAAVEEGAANGNECGGEDGEEGVGTNAAAVAAATALVPSAIDATTASQSTPNSSLEAIDGLKTVAGHAELVHQQQASDRVSERMGAYVLGTTPAPYLD
eukprot:UC1_evm1s115